MEKNRSKARIFRIIFLVLCPILIISAIILLCSEKQTFYVPEEHIYIMVDRNSEGDSAFVYFGCTQEDIDNKTDFYVVNKVGFMNHYTEFIKLKNNDSIFVVCEHGYNIRIGKTTKFKIVPHSAQRETIKMYDSDKESCSVGHLPDSMYLRRFKENPQKYSVFHYYWERHWFKKNKLWMYEEYFTPNNIPTSVSIAPL